MSTLIWTGKQINYEGITFPSEHLIPLAPAQSRYIMPAMKVDMELHGAAIAVLPSKTAPDIYELHFNPVAISNVIPTDYTKVMDYRVLENLKFCERFSVLKAQEVKKVFIKLVDALEQLITIQDKACEEAWVDPQPISIIIGQDMHNPVNLNAVHLQLFGAIFKEPVRPLDYGELKKGVKENKSLLEFATHFYLATGSRAVDGFVQTLASRLKSGDYQKCCNYINKTKVFVNSEQTLSPDDLKDHDLLRKKIETALEENRKNNVAHFPYLPALLGPLHRYFPHSAITFEQLSDDEKSTVVELACAIHDVCDSGAVNPTQIADHIRSSKPGFTLDAILTKFTTRKIHQSQLRSILSSGGGSRDAQTLGSFAEAAERLTRIVGKAIVKPGNYTGGWGTNIASSKRKLAVSAEAVEKEMIEQADRYYRHLEYVRALGAQKGKEQSEPGEKNQRFTVFPESNLDESAEVRNTFNRAFQEAYTGPHSRFLMQGLDSNTPPFVIGLLWMAADQFQILFGDRHPADVEDFKSVRTAIENALKSQDAEISSLDQRVFVTQQSCS